jgi:F0F1-type ATP synthase assembly protein I
MEIGIALMMVGAFALVVGILGWIVRLVIGGKKPTPQTTDTQEKPKTQTKRYSTPFVVVLSCVVGFLVIGALIGATKDSLKGGASLPAIVILIVVVGCVGGIVALSLKNKRK